MMRSIHHSPDLRLRFNPSAHDPLDVLVPMRKVPLVLAEDTDLGLANGDFIAQVSAESAGVSPVFLHDAAGGEQALDQVVFGHGATVARAAGGCERHNRDLTIADQKGASPNYLYLRGAIGEHEDANPETETVTYRMPDGSEWVDGQSHEATP